MTPAQVGAYSTLALAHIGDGVYELMMRTALCAAGLTAVTDLHRETVRRVNAPAQARAAEAILPLLTEAEHAVYKRGRNAKVNSVPQHADVAQYHAATGLETLFWLAVSARPHAAAARAVRRDHGGAVTCQWTQFFLHGLTQELTQSLTGARIDKVQQPERDLLLLSVRTQGGNARLLVHGGVGSARVHFTAGTFENPAEPPMFCMLLRKHLVGARITAVSQPDFERMLVLDLDGRDELGTPVKKQLVVEMLGRQSNVILVSGDGHIIDCMRRVDSSMSETRQVQPGLFLPYAAAAG